MNEYDVLDLIGKTGGVIADYYGMNVPYCESIDMSLFPQPIYVMQEDDEASLDDLRFLAENGRLLPEELANATMEEFQAYCKEHRKEILDEIEGECRAYLSEYAE